MRSQKTGKKMSLMLMMMVIILMTYLDKLDDGVTFMAQAKRARCVNKLKSGDQDFFYCTKFAVAKGTQFKAWYYAKLT